MPKIFKYLLFCSLNNFHIIDLTMRELLLIKKENGFLWISGKESPCNVGDGGRFRFDP